MKRIFVALIICVMSMPVLAVTTSHWEQGNETDFKAGKTHNVVVSSLGDVKLSRAVKTIADQNPDVTQINALVDAGGGLIYAGTGPKGILLAIKDGKVSTSATIDGAVNILSLLSDDHGLVLGTGGDAGKIYRIEKPGSAPKEIFSDPDVQYVWAMQKTSDGNIYAATGPNGKLFEIKADGSHSLIYKSTENNLTALLSDGKDLLYLGTDPDGLVIRFNRKTKDSFVLYNAAESDITALALDDLGNLYASTGQAVGKEPPTPPGMEKPSPGGRPATQESSQPPIPSNPAPTPPKPPPAPIPNPSAPRPIPKKSSYFFDSADLPAVRILPVAAQTDDIGDQPPDDPDMSDGPPQSPQAMTEAQDQSEGPTKSEGNAIYQISPDGFVNEIFRRHLMIYSMLWQKDSLLVGTGNDGTILQINPAAEETAEIATVDAKQVTCFLALKNGEIFMGLANSGGIAQMTSGYADTGTYISSVLDAQQVSRFGKISLHGLLPVGTTLKVATRSGNVKDADSDGWSKWSEDVNATEYVQVTSPAARFLQYRLTFSSTDAAHTPVVDHVSVAYQMPNLAPVIKSVKIVQGGQNGPGGPGGPMMQHQQGPGGPGGSDGPGGGSDDAKPAGTGVQAIVWDASDPNNDSLVFSVYFRLEQTGEWILLKDKLKDPEFDWDTHSVADGRYQIKVVASDAAANLPGQGKTASRISDYLVVVNTPPAIGDVSAKVTGNNFQVSVRVQTHVTTVAGVKYSVDSADQWQAVFPSDNIFDGPDETVTFTVNGLSAGSHQITIQATDAQGNRALQTIMVKTGG